MGAWGALPTTKAPETQIYFITHGSGAFPVPRVRTVVRGERASRSIVNRTTAWLRVVAGLGIALNVGREVAESLGSNGISKIAQWAVAKWSTPNKWKETNINSGVV